MIIDYIQETWWTRTNGCRGQNFMWSNKKRDEDPIWPSASLASSLSVFIRSAQTNYKHYFSNSNIVMAGHSATISETVQGWLSSETQLSIYYLVFSSSHFWFQGHLVLWNIRGLPNPGPPWFCATCNCQYWKRLPGGWSSRGGENHHCHHQLLLHHHPRLDDRWKRR